MLATWLANHKHQADPQIHNESHTPRGCHLQRVPSSGMFSVMKSMNQLHAPQTKILER
jgi:hypothetical protein